MDSKELLLEFRNLVHLIDEQDLLIRELLYKRMVTVVNQRYQLTLKEVNETDPVDFGDISTKTQIVE